ncbi:response regulator [Pseudodesulfovibrio sp. zrk46]|nr:response regulator [Pseudodesulfovibrio sp. zrk46]
MLVDDEVHFVETLEKRLGKRGFEVCATSSGEEALEKLHDFDADVVVLDVKMPGMDGIAVLNQIKTQWPLMEVVMLTGHASVEVAIRGMELGAFDYLMKPMEFQDLIYKVEDAAKQKRLKERKISRTG